MSRAAFTRWVAMSLSLLASAQMGHAAQPSADPVKSFETSGRIVAFDAQRKVLTFETAPKGEALQRIDFSVDEQAAISRAGVLLKPEDLQASEEAVTIEYVMREGTPVVRTISFEKPAGLLRTDGTVEAIDLLKGEVAIKPSGLFAGDTQKLFVIVNEYTLVSKSGQRAYLTDLKTGDHVTIEYTKRTDQLVAYSLAIEMPQQPERL